MENFRKHKNMIKEKECNGGKQFLFKFDNKYGASVVKHCFSYGHEDGLWELAVLDEEDEICYDTEITNDVLGHLTEEDVLYVLTKISKL